MVLPDSYQHGVIALLAVIGTERTLKFAQYIAKALPPLSPQAGWWKRFGYNLVKNVGGIDPNTVSLKPFDGVDRRKINGVTP